ncbi:MAG TPA: class I SAM-dependent methyltransferase [Bacteroidia bacterium]|nr:class I SAM-dependent methyltransferase [Bacteroidia bacterium]
MEEVDERVTPGTISWERYGAEHFQRYKFFEAYYKDKSVLDAACGTGYGTHHIISNGAKSAMGVDISDEAIKFCKANYSHKDLLYSKFDCSKLNEIGRTFDLVVSFETIEHLKDPEAFIKNVAATLQPNGTFICSTPNKDRLSGLGWGVNPYHPSELEWEEFRTIFEKYFLVEEAYHQSETIEYLRIQELKHLIHQSEARSQAFIFNRIELFFRKLFGKPFKPVPFYHANLDDQRYEDLYIERLKKKETWHKTFIIVGKVKH